MGAAAGAGAATAAGGGSATIGASVVLTGGGTGAGGSATSTLPIRAEAPPSSSRPPPWVVPAASRAFTTSRGSAGAPEDETAEGHGRRGDAAVGRRLAVAAGEGQNAGNAELGPPYAGARCRRLRGVRLLSRRSRRRGRDRVALDIGVVAVVGADRSGQI